MDARRGEALAHGRQQIVGRADAMAVGPIAGGVLDEIRVAVVEAPIGKAHVGLLPLDHAVAVVAQNEDHEVHPEAHCGLQLLGIHHKAAVAADGHDLFVWLH